MYLYYGLTALYYLLIPFSQGVAPIYYTHFVYLHWLDGIGIERSSNGFWTWEAWCIPSSHWIRWLGLPRL